MIETLYHQTVAGNKTQTRRSGGLDAVNGCKATKTKPAIVTNPDDWILIEERRDGSFHFEEKPTSELKPMLDYRICKPRYQIGEVLFLKEPYMFLKSDSVDFWNGYAYKFGARAGTATSDKGCELGGPDFKFENKLFMPSAAAREYIRITGIKCERVLDISHKDSEAEGIEFDRNTGWINYDKKKEPKTVAFGSPKRSFFSLFRFANKISHKKETGNPWVWVYSFEHLKNFKP